MNNRRVLLGGRVLAVLLGISLSTACTPGVGGDDFPDFLLVNTCDATIDATSTSFSGPFTLAPGEMLTLHVSIEGESLTFALSVDGVTYDTVTGVSPLNITSCPT